MQGVGALALLASLCAAGPFAAGPVAAAVPAKPVEIISYGPHPRQRFVIWHARAGGAAAKPVYINFFGGAFLFGGPNGGPFRAALMAQGVTVVGGGYRFRQDGVTKLEIMEDGARIVQYLRANADRFNIDPRRIGVGGFSSGGVIAAWIAQHPELGNPRSPDPVQRQSSRVSVCCLEGSQVHPIRLQDWVHYTGSDPTRLQNGIFNFILHYLYGAGFRDPILRADYATQAEYEAAKWAYQQKVFSFYLCSRDDPPLCIYSNASDDPARYVRSPQGGGLHSPLLMIPMRRRLNENGVPTAWGGFVPARDFILRYLKPAPP